MHFPRWQEVLDGPVLEQVSQWHKTCHDLEVISSNPCWVENRVGSLVGLLLSWLSRTLTKSMKQWLAEARHTLPHHSSILLSHLCIKNTIWRCLFSSSQWCPVLPRVRAVGGPSVWTVARLYTGRSHVHRHKHTATESNFTVRQNIYILRYYGKMFVQI